MIKRDDSPSDGLESGVHFRILFEQIAVGIAFVGADGRWLQVNQKLCDMLGYTRAELADFTFQDITYPEDLALDLLYVERMLADEIQTCVLEKRYIRKDGSLIWINLTVSLVRDSSGVPIYFISVVEDISQRKAAEAEKALLLAREQSIRLDAASRASQLEAIITAMADAVLVYDQDAHIVFASPTAYELFPFNGLPDLFSLPTEARAEHYFLRDENGQPFPPGLTPADRLLRGEVLKGDQTVDIRMRVRDGREIQVSLSGSPIRDSRDQITGAVLIARDVTQRRNLVRRTQHALEGLLTMAEALVQLPEHAEEPASVSLQLVELTRSVLGCQRASLLILDAETQILRPQAVVGLSPEQEQQWWIEQQQASTLDESPQPEYVARLRNNEVLVIDMTQAPFNDQPNPFLVQTMLAAPMCIGEALMGVLMLDYGPTQHTYTHSEKALASAVAKLSALVIERQRLLREQAEARGRELALREANSRMEEFLGVASHELRTPLTTIKANVQLAMRRLKVLMPPTIQPLTEVSDRVEAAQGMLIRAERQVGILNRLVGDLIDISRIQTGKLQLHLRKEPCDLLTVVRDAVLEQRKAVPARIINLNLPDVESIPIIADSYRIVQVLTNYLSNALKYSFADQPVEVSLQLLEPAGTSAYVAVQDHGPGLSPEEQQRVWECFYQAPEIKVMSGSGVGLGIGLYISQKLIERHEGKVGVNSTLGHGSTFWFTLPIFVGERILEST